MLAYPSIWARLMGVFSTQRINQNPDENPGQHDTEEIFSRAAGTSTPQEVRDNPPEKRLKETS